MPGDRVAVAPDGSFHEIALVRGSETYEASRPFEVSLTPALLVAGV